MKYAQWSIEVDYLKNYLILCEWIISPKEIRESGSIYSWSQNSSRSFLVWLSAIIGKNPENS